MIEQLHALGLAMGSRYSRSIIGRTNPDAETAADRGDAIYGHRYVGWTTDQAKADAARELGAAVTECRSHDPKFSGWEVSVSVADDAA